MKPRVLGIVFAVALAIATALVFGMSAPARFPCAPHWDVVGRIHGGR